VSLQLENIPRDDPRFPAKLRERLGRNAPPQVTALGNLDLLASPKTALFYSARCPGKAILTTHDQAAKWRDTGRCVISGFHSSVEKECLRILLRGSQPIIICPARAVPKRVPGREILGIFSLTACHGLVYSCAREKSCRGNAPIPHPRPGHL